MATGALPCDVPACVIGSPQRVAASDLEELLTVDEVAALLKVTKSWIYEHTRSRGIPRSERLPHVKVGKYVRFDARLVREFLVKHTRIG
jgi:excisionase family DNA binding protein